SPCQSVAYSSSRCWVRDVGPALVELVVNVVVEVVAAVAEVVHTLLPFLLLDLRLALRRPPGGEDGVPALVIGLLDVLAGRAMTALAAAVLQVRRLLLATVARLVAEADRMTDDALRVVLAQRRLLRVRQRLEGVRVLRLLPNVVGGIVALLAAIRADVGR